ncbi:hypothetical protein T484DRAFT_1770890 [Baffinella frigidus]|nr:hypothetical protein T484DRAFT_1770890 [Cryptophyta sp. CCMP2293]
MDLTTRSPRATAAATANKSSDSLPSVSSSNCATAAAAANKSSDSLAFGVGPLSLRNTATRLLNRYVQSVVSDFDSMAARLVMDPDQSCPYVQSVVSDFDSMAARRAMDPDQELPDFENRGTQEIPDFENRDSQGVLKNVPFALPFELRIRILRHLIAQDRISLHADNPGCASGSSAT